jgi:hypothetical protein
LVLDCRDGVLVARCGCGGWEAEQPAVGGRLVPAFIVVEEEHRWHCHAVARERDFSPATGRLAFAG